MASGKNTMPRLPEQRAVNTTSNANARRASVGTTPAATTMLNTRAAISLSNAVSVESIQQVIIARARGEGDGGVCCDRSMVQSVKKRACKTQGSHTLLLN